MGLSFPFAASTLVCALDEFVSTDTLGAVDVAGVVLGASDPEDAAVGSGDAAVGSGDVDDREAGPGDVRGVTKAGDTETG